MADQPIPLIVIGVLGPDRENQLVTAAEDVGSETNVGVWVETQCRELGISVAEVARKARIDRSTIFRWKTGQVEPYWNTFRRIKIVIDDFWGERGGKAG